MTFCLFVSGGITQMLLVGTSCRKKSKKMCLGTSKIPLKLESDLDHRLDKKTWTFQLT